MARHNPKGELGHGTPYDGHVGSGRDPDSVCAVAHVHLIFASRRRFFIAARRSARLRGGGSPVTQRQANPQALTSQTCPIATSS